MDFLCVGRSFCHKFHKLDIPPHSSAFWALTAAHCVPTGNLYFLRSAPGFSSNEPGRGQVRPVRRVLRHSTFDRVDFENDIAMLQVDKVIFLISLYFKASYVVFISFFDIHRR